MPRGQPTQTNIRHSNNSSGSPLLYRFPVLTTKTYALIHMHAKTNDCAKNTVRPTPPSICISIWLNQTIKYIDTAKHVININFRLAIACKKYNGEALTMLLKFPYPDHNADHGRNATIIHRNIQPFHTPGNPRMYTNRSAIGPHYQNWDPLGVEHVHEVAINIFTIDSNNSTYTWATGVPHNKKSTQNSQAHVHRPNMAMHKNKTMQGTVGRHSNRQETCKTNFPNHKYQRTKPTSKTWQRSCDIKEAL